MNSAGKPLIVALMLIFAPRLFAAQEATHYDNTNHLSSDKSFVASLKTFFGNLKETYFYDGLVYEQVGEGLGGPPDDIRKIEGTSLFFASACRYHSCDEKAAVIYEDAEHVISFGVIHYCFNGSNLDVCRDRPVLSRPILSIFYKAEPLDQKLRDAMVEWAQDRVGKIDTIRTQVVR
jgi:hypothetical protein